MSFNGTESQGEEVQGDENAGPPDFNAEQEESPIVQEPGQPRNNGLLVLVTLLLVGGVAVYFMHLRSGPKAASASTEATSANDTINQFLNNGDKSMKDMHQLLKNTEKFVQQFKNDPAKTQVGLEELKTDPFRSAKAAAPDHSAEDAAKAAQERAKQKQAEKEAVLKAVQQLQIQSILTSGKVRTCMINNAMYTEGQEVSGFKIEKINPDGVMLTRGGYRLQVKMNR